MIQLGEASKQWERFHTGRTESLARAERAARVTIPSLFPPEGHTEGSDLRDPYQSLGARAVNTLASKIMLALFPPNTPFFSLSFDEVIEAKLRANNLDLGQVKESLSMLENVAVSELESTNMRPVMNIAVRHLITAGNACVRLKDDRSFKFFSLRHFIVRRDPSGNVLDLIVKERVDPDALPEEVRESVLTDNADTRHAQDREPVDVYTVMTLREGRYKVWQEINDLEVPGSDGDYPKKNPPFLVLRWTEVSGENYGRGMVDDYYGDFKALDDLCRDLLKASAAAAKVIYLRDPNSITSKRKLERAKSGDILDGRPEDIGTLTLDKFQDFQVSLERIRDIRSELVEAFLMHSSVQRDAERVTAEEIRFVAQELEDALGGVYSLLSHELQTPLARRWLKILGAKRQIPNIPEEVNLTVTTGLEALGRGHEVQKLLGFVRMVADTLGPEYLAERLQGEGFLSRLAAGVGLNLTDLIKTEEQVQQERQQAMMQQAAQDAAPGVAQEAVRQGGNPNG